ncbi:MAG TPA: terminase [Erysipelotrichaceae bacterium]|nr:terminase [Erysipelotrichaceae bacterium]
MFICQEIKNYLAWVEINPDKVNDERKLLIKNIVLPLLARDDITFDETTYRNCLKYCQHWYYPLFPYQKFCYAFVFMFDAEGYPVFDNFLFMMGRGNGKDGFMMPLMNFFQTPLFGIKNYHVDIVANAEDPAHNSYLVVYNMLEANAAKVRKLFYWNKVEIINRETQSILRYNTSNAKTKYGKQTGAILFNEYHTYVDYSQIKTFTSGLGKIKHPRTFIITTNGDVREGPLDQMLELCRQILNGELKHLRIFPFICKIDNESEIDKPEAWEKPNPSMEFLPELKRQIQRDYEMMSVSPRLRNEFITMRLNWPRVNADTAVVEFEKVIATNYLIEKKEDGSEWKIERVLPDLTDETTVVGVDYADLRDFASVRFIFKLDGIIYTKGMTWVNIRSPFYRDMKFDFASIGQNEFMDFVLVDAPTIDPDLCAKYIYDHIDQYQIAKIVMDNYKFRLVRQAFEAYGFIVESKQNPHGAIRMIHNFPSVMAMTIPSILFYLQEEKIISEKSAMWRWSINNTGLKIEQNGNMSFFKIEPRLRKNDPFMAFAAGMSAEQLLDVRVIYI